MKPEKEHKTKGMSLAIVLTIFVIFAGIVLLTGILGNLFGKTAETVGLVVVAAVLAVMLYKAKQESKND